MPVPSVPRSLFRAAAVALPLVLAAPVFIPRAAAEFDPVPRRILIPFVYPDQYVGTGGMGDGEVESRMIDLDGDGHPDLVNNAESGGTARGVYWTRGLETQDLSRQPAFGDRRQLTALNLDQFEFADIDGDGYLDLVGRLSIPSVPLKLVWLRNLRGETGEVSFETTPRTIATPSGSDGIYLTAAGDLDGDGLAEVIGYSGGDRLFVYPGQMNSGVQSFGTTLTPLSNTFWTPGFRDGWFQMADLDGDGDLDLVFVGNKQGLGPDSYLAWLENTRTDVAGYALELRTDVSVETDLPGSSATAKLTAARIGGQWYFRFYAPGVAGVSYRADQPGLDPGKLAALTALLDRTQAGTAPPDSARRVVIQAAALFHYHTGPLAFQVHYLERSFTDATFMLQDLDGDGDLDIFLFSHGRGEAAYSGSFYENRLNEDLHKDLLERRRVDLAKITAILGARLYDFDSKGQLDLACNTTVYGGTSVLENVSGLMTGGEPHYHTISETESRARFATYPPVSDATFYAADLDHDGDLDIIREVRPAGQGIDVYENLGSSSPPAPFITPSLSLFTERTTSSVNGLRAVDANGDGWPEIYLTFYPSGQDGFRNDLGKAPAFGFVPDAGLPPLPPQSGDAAAAAVLHDFDAWRALQPWMPVVISSDISPGVMRVAVDVDGDGDLDVVSFASDGDLAQRWLLWYENVTPAGGAPAFRGPHGISSATWPSGGLYSADIDADGDQDLLILQRLDSNFYDNWIVRAFLNRTAPSQDPVIDGITADPVVQASFSHSDFTAAMQTSDDLVHWDAAVAIPAQDLLNPAAMKAHLQWKDASRPQRFYRMLYTTTP